MSRNRRSEQLQIRVSPAEKAAIRRAAEYAGIDMSAYVLGRALPTPAMQLQACVDSCAGPAPASFGLAELNSLIARCAQYLLATKCLAMGSGAEFHDEADARYLLRHLDIDSYARALAVITQYYPLERFPQKALYALEEILARPATGTDA
jgi:hypothetical protein